MTTIAGVGTSHHHNPNVAGREAADQALENAGIVKPDIVFMFASIGYDQRSLLRAVRETTGGSPLSGCSAEGTINGDDADESNFSVVVTVISSEELQWTNGLAKGLGADSRAVGQRVAQDLLPHLSSDTIGLFVFPDGLIDYLDDFFAGLEETSQASSSSHSGVGELATTSIWRSQPINIVTTKLSPTGLPTRCPRVEHRLVGLSVTAWSR
jgi:hypothetical protein